MIFETIFAFSGLCIALLIAAKAWELKTKKSFFLLRGISRGDEKMRVLSHKAEDLYVLAKERGGLFVRRDLPLHMKSGMNKTNNFIAERAEELVGNIRGTRFLKKDGMSEFFKNMSEKEEGRIDDTLESRTQTEESKTE
jgi:hypothetical protein